RGRILRRGVPVRLALPEAVQAGELVRAPTEVGQHLLGDGARVTGVGAPARTDRVLGLLGEHRLFFAGADAHDLVAPLAGLDGGDELPGDLLTSGRDHAVGGGRHAVAALDLDLTLPLGQGGVLLLEDRKSTRLNSSHVKISYAVFCLKKKKEIV